jgi:hypothetical protein
MVGSVSREREGVQQPYHDCKCSYDKLSTLNPTCDYITLMDVNEAKRRKCVDIDEQENYFKSMSWYDIRVALLVKHLPLSDDIHRPFKMMPSELLHTSGSGLIMYMFELLHHQLGGGNNSHFINQEHIIISNIITWQRERDYPRGSTQNGLIDGTKCQSSERKGNLFWLMCIAHQTTVGNVLKSAVNLSDGTWKSLLDFYKCILPWKSGFMITITKKRLFI